MTTAPRYFGPYKSFAGAKVHTADDAVLCWEFRDIVRMMVAGGWYENRNLVLAADRTPAWIGFQKRLFPTLPEPSEIVHARGCVGISINLKQSQAPHILKQMFFLSFERWCWQRSCVTVRTEIHRNLFDRLPRSIQADF
jgi:hypothetical protein